MKKELMLVGMISIILLLTGCENVLNTGGAWGSTTSNALSDQQPKVCSEWDIATIVNAARQEYILAHPNTNTTDWAYDPATGFVEPTSIDIPTHVLIYQKDGITLFRNQTFTISVSGAVVGTAQVTTADAKAEFTTHRDFTSLNEVTITVTPVANSSYLSTPITFKKFVPCQATTWIINVPYDLKANTSASTPDTLDVPKVNIKNDNDYTISQSNPVYIAPGEVRSFKVMGVTGGANKKMTFEFNRDQIIKVELYDPDGNFVPQTSVPLNATLRRVGDLMFAVGPIIKTGDYKIILFAEKEVQPIDQITVLLMNGETVEKASDIFFAAKTAIVQDYVTNNRMTLVAAIILIVAAVLLMSGKKK